MKKIHLLLLILLQTFMFAQTTPSYKNVKLTGIPLGIKNDSLVIWNGSTKLLKHIPLSQITAPTNLTATASPSGVTVFSSTGNDAVLPMANTTDAGLLSPTDKSKIESSATISQAQTIADLKVVNNLATNNTSLAPSLNAVNTALNLKANIDSPTFTGIPIAPTASIGTSTTQIATTEFVQGSFVNLTGNQSITGRKTFNSSNTTLGGLNLINSRTTNSPGTSDAVGLYINNTGQSGITIEAFANNGLSAKSFNEATAVAIQSFGSGTALTLGNQGGTGDLMSAGSNVTRITLTGNLLAASPTFTGSVTVPNGVLSTDAINKGQLDSAVPTFLEYNTTDKTLWNNGKLNEASNTSFGQNALKTFTSGYENTAFGGGSLSLLSTGSNNTSVGHESLLNISSGNNNTGLGEIALRSITSGSSNTGIGRNAGDRLADGTTANTLANQSTYIGSDTKAFVNNATNETVIGYNAIGNGSNTVTLGNNSVTATVLKGLVTAPLTTNTLITADATGKALTTKEYVSSVIPVAPISIANGTSLFSLPIGGGLSSSGTQALMLGSGAGYDANGANQSNFLGADAGNSAINASKSNFFGFSAGASATGASNSNFFGYSAGNNADNVTHSNIFGFEAGYASSGNNINAFGNHAAYGNTLSGQTIFSNASLPSYADRTAATTAITVANGASAGSTYLYYNATTFTIEAVRLP